MRRAATQQRGDVALLTHTVLTLGAQGTRLHQLHTTEGKFFVMGEVAVQLFQQPPNAFVAELRKGRYAKATSAAPDVLDAVVELGLPVESTAHAGVMLLPPATVEALLQDKRRLDLLQPLKMALLKTASQEAARLMAAGDYEAALPVALDAVALGEKLFKPQPALQLFPLYLLAAQANLGLRRASQCEQCLALASVLSLREPNLTSNTMHSQLSRLYGQLYALQAKPSEALQAFAEDVYFSSLEYGPQDAATSLGYYNVAKVLQSTGDLAGMRGCSDMVVSIWSVSLQRCVLGCLEDGRPLPAGAPTELPVGRLQLGEVVEMLQDIARLRAEQLGAAHPEVAGAHLVASLALLALGEEQRAAQELAAAQEVLSVAAQQPEAEQQQQAAAVEQLLRRVQAHVSGRASGAAP